MRRRGFHPLHLESLHRPHRDRRTTVVLAIDRLEHFFETLPVDRIPQQDQLVLRIDDIPQQDLEEVRLNGGGGVTFRHHFRGLPLQFTWFYAQHYNILRANNQLLF